MCESGYSIADIAIWPWYGRLAMGRMYDAGEFLDTDSYEHVVRWAKQIRNRAAVEQGLAAYR
jgi:GST-like protein